MHANMSQEPFYTEIYRKNAGAQLEHPDQAPAFTRTVDTVFGEQLSIVQNPLSSLWSSDWKGFSQWILNFPSILLRKTPINNRLFFHIAHWVQVSF
jgi:hypothetical protein